MRRNLFVAAALGGAAYWASKQPGGIQGTVKRLQQGFRDIQAGQDPREVGKRFIAGTDTTTTDLDTTTTTPATDSLTSV